MLQPKNTKYRKAFRGRMKGRSKKATKVTVGEYALQSLDRVWLTGNQIEAARKAIVRETKRRGKLWLRVFPDKPFTGKPAEVGMGKGKGDVQGYVFVLKPGRVIFELSGVDEHVARAAFKRAGDKLPVKTRVIRKEAYKS